MKTETPAPWEDKMHAVAASFSFPATPDVRAGVRKRLARGITPKTVRRVRWAWAALIVLIVLVSLLAVPGVRAQIANFIQIGVVKIFPNAETPTPTSLPATAASTPSPVPVFISSLQNLAGETTLETAQKTLKFPARLPAYPPNLGLPDHVYLQTGDGQMLVLVWNDPSQPAQTLLSLQMITASYSIGKYQPQVIQETTVNGHKAVWVEGPYWFQLRNGAFDTRQIVEGNTLIWTEGEITYRLETASSLEEAVKIAESLK